MQRNLILFLHLYLRPLFVLDLGFNNITSWLGPKLRSRDGVAGELLLGRIKGWLFFEVALVI